MNWNKEADQIKADIAATREIGAHEPTIGWGRNLRSVGISREEAEVLFATDLRRAWQACLRTVPVFRYLDPDRRGVLVNMCFNLGAARLGTFKRFLAALDRRDFNAAADEMQDSLWYRQVGKRAERLAQRMRSTA